MTDIFTFITTSVSRIEPECLSVLFYSFTILHEIQRVNARAVLVDLKVEVVARGLTCRADIADDLALFHIFACGNRKRAAMRVARGICTVVPDEHVIAPGPVVLRRDDLEIGRASCRERV